MALGTFYQEIIAIVIWVLFAILDGAVDAMMYHVKNVNKSLPVNEHIYYTIQRLLVAIACIALAGWWIIPSLILVFPFLHDGMYYFTRNKLNPGVYYFGWFDHSNTSTAVLTKFLTPEVRTFLFFLGISIVGLRMLIIYV